MSRGGGIAIQLTQLARDIVVRDMSRRIGQDQT
jgi:hypothetical protein